MLYRTVPSKEGTSITPLKTIEFVIINVHWSILDGKSDELTVNVDKSEPREST